VSDRDAAKGTTLPVFPVVAWAADPPLWDERGSFGVPVFVRTAIAPYKRIVVARALRHPVHVLTCLVRVRSIKAVLGFLVWLDTAELFRVERVVTPAGAPSPLTRLLPRSPRTFVGRKDRVAGFVMTQDDAPRLRQALESLAPIVDELVVVDGGSRDDSVAAAQALGARVVHRAFDKDFAAQRNAGLAEVTAEWIVSIDTDEVLPPELATVIQAVVRHCDADAVQVPRLNVIDELEQPSLWPDEHLRAFRRGLRFVRPVHERLRGVQRIIVLPVTGPAILHRKTLREQQAQVALYEKIEQSKLTRTDARRVQSWVDQHEHQSET
jgi:hypothetical protein